MHTAALVANYKQSRKPRKVAERLARPAWANLRLMREFYVLAEKCRAVGVNVQVDHEVPLRGKTVCGLDREGNYRLMLAVDNSRKNNHFGALT